MNGLIFLAFIVWYVWIIRRDTARRDGISSATWIPTFWVGILASRPLSTWIGIGQNVGDASYSIEGSPVDRYFFMTMIFSSLYVLSKRRINWGQFFSVNWMVMLFYAYMCVSVLWADSPVVSFKRWFKDFGNIFVALVILTEKNPQQAFRAVFVRCAYLLIPLSIIFIRYFPDLGRRYNIHSGEMEATGVTFQKNSLGAMVMVCALGVIWDWFDRPRQEGVKTTWKQKFLPFFIVGLGIWLFKTSDSKTSMACLALGGGILACVQLPFVKRNVTSLGRNIVIGIVTVALLDWMFGIKEFIVESMGRDLTFTGRTDVWKVLLDLHTDPIFGTGFCSFWSDEHYLSKLPYWVAFSAHNGYIEVYIDGGMIGVVLLVIMLIAVGVKINGQLATAGNYAAVRFAVLLMTIIGDFSESHFGRIGPVWFTFLLCALDLPRNDESHQGYLPMNRRFQAEPSHDRLPETNAVNLNR